MSMKWVMMNNDWKELFIFSPFKSPLNGETYWRAHFKHDNSIVGYGSSEDYLGAESVAYNWVNNVANQKKLADMLFELYALE